MREHPHLTAVLCGAATIAIMWVIVGVLTGEWRLGRLIEGADQRASTSKFQWWLWTGVAFFSYGALYGVRMISGSFGPLDAPPHLLYAMGFSSVTMAGAKAITSGYSASGQVVKTPAGAVGAAQVNGLQGILVDDGGTPDLSKIQMLGWTLLASVVYLVAVWNVIPAILTNGTMPDIDQGLMVLMGLGQGAYLGKKLVTTDTARLTGLSLGSGQPGTQITVSGASFGAGQNGSLITIDGAPLAVAVAAWQDTQVAFTLPLQRADGTPWAPGQRIQIGLIVGGSEGANTLPFTVT